MLYLRKKLFGLACVALFGCAAGVGDEDALADFAVDQANVFNGLDAGAALPSVATGDAAVLSTPAWSVPIPPAASTSTSPSVPATTGTAPSSTPAASTPVASTPATSTSTPPAASSTTADAGSATRDAGTTTSTPTTPAPSAPMCSPFKCNINCLLLAPCCNEQNECMCLSPIRGCVLPGL